MQFLLLEKRIVFTVTDHMDMFINLEKLDDTYFIKQTIQEYNSYVGKEMFVTEEA